MSEDSYSGFNPELNQERFKQKTEVIKGVQYNTLVFRQIVLTADKAGDYVFEPSVAKIEIPLGRRRSIWRQTRTETIGSDSLSLKIVPVLGKKKSMAVGTYSLRAAIDNRTIKLSDAMKLSVVVNGEGSMDLLGSPRINGKKNFEIYDPEIADLNTSSNENKYIRGRSFEYAIVPKSVGNFTIDCEISYFDIDSLKVIKKNQKINLRVLPGESGLTESMQEIQDEVSQNLLIPMKPDALRKKKNSFFLSFGHIGLLATVFVPLFLSYKRDKEDTQWNQLDDTEKRKRKAWKKVASHFEEIEKEKSTLSPREFYNRAGAAFSSYLGQKFKIDAADFHLDQVIKKFDENSISEELKEKTIQLFDKSQKARFAPISTDESPIELFQSLRDLVLSIEESNSSSE